jgi:hypothetical protein
MIVALFAVILGARVDTLSGDGTAYPAVTTPPDSFFEKVREADRDVAREFYQKYVDIKGMPVVAAAEVADLALHRTYDIVTHMLAGRPDLLKAMAVLGRQGSDEAMLKANDTIRRMFAYRHDILKSLIADGVKLVVLGPDERISDLPDYKNAIPKSSDHTARFLDYAPQTTLLVVGQENVLAEPKDPYATGCQVIRAFAKALYYVTGTRPVDPNFSNRGRTVQQYELRVQRMDVRFDEKLKKVYDRAITKGLWKATAAVHNRVEYWAEGLLAYFDAIGPGAPANPRFRGDKLAPGEAGADRPITTREDLKEYDPDLFALVDETMAYKGKVNWRYRQ